MTNRKKILKAAEQAGYKVKSLVFERERDCAYGDSWDASYWLLETECGECFASDNGDTVDDGVDIMIEEILSESNNGFGVN